MLDLAEFAALVAEFRRKGTDLARSPGRQILAVRFALRGVGLALGGDKQRTQAAGGGAAYFALHGRDSSGRLHKLGASTPGGGGEPSPRWEPLEVATAALASCRQLRVEVWEGAISRNLGSELAQSRASFGASSGSP